MSRDIGSRIASQRKQIAAAADPLGRLDAGFAAVRSLARGIQQGGDGSGGDELRDKAADLLADLFEHTATTLEAANTGRPAGAAPTDSPRRASQ